MEKKKTLLVITSSIRRANIIIKTKYRGIFMLENVYKIKYVTKLDDIRGYQGDDFRIMYIPGYYNLREANSIQDYIDTHNLKKI